MKPAPDVRDRLIDAAMRYASNELDIRALTKRMHASQCQASPPCWVQDEAAAWRDPKAQIPESYCDECVRSTILCRERHDLRLRRGKRREMLLRRAEDFKGSIYGAFKAEPVAGSGGANRDHITGGHACTTHPSTATT